MGSWETISEVIDYIGPIIAIITILLNALEIYIIVSTRKTKLFTVSTIYFLNFSISNLFVGIATKLQ